MPASGRHLSTRVCEVARVENDEIVSLHLYWDNVAFLRAVGALEPQVD
jgi:ketosteroid isomerase-like protein